MGFRGINEKGVAEGRGSQIKIYGIEVGRRGGEGEFKEVSEPLGGCPRKVVSEGGGRG